MRSYGRDPYLYVEQNNFRLFGDALLALFDGKLTQKLPYGERPEKPFYLGEVSGVVRFPTPILNEAGRIRIHLVPADRPDKNGSLTKVIPLKPMCA